MYLTPHHFSDSVILFLLSTIIFYLHSYLSPLSSVIGRHSHAPLSYLHCHSSMLSPPRTLPFTQPLIPDLLKYPTSLLRHRPLTTMFVSPRLLFQSTSKCILSSQCLSGGPFAACSLDASFLVFWDPCQRLPANSWCCFPERVTSTLSSSGLISSTQICSLLQVNVTGVWPAGLGHSS